MEPNLAGSIYARSKPGIVVKVFSKSVFPCYIPVFWTTLYSDKKQVWQYIEGEIYIKTT
jgi:hypothetical protein